MVEPRGKVVPVIDAGIKPKQVVMLVELNDGRVLKKRIEPATGNLEKSRSEADLDRKFTDLAGGIPPPHQTSGAMDLCWKAEGLADAGETACAAARST